MRNPSGPVRGSGKANPASRRRIRKGEPPERRVRGVPEAAGKTEAFFRAIVGSSPDVTAVIDRSGNLLYVSPSVERILGYPPSELLGTPLSDHIDCTPVATGAGSPETGLFQGDPRLPRPLCLRHRDGTLRLLEVTGDTLRGRPFAGGRVLSIRDTTGRRAAGDDATAGGGLSDLLMLARIGLWEYDIVRDLFTFNDPFYRLLRTTVERVGDYRVRTAQYADRFVHPADRQAFIAGFANAVRTTPPGRHGRFEHRTLFEDGAVGHIVGRYVVLRDPVGVAQAGRGLSQDVSDQKQAEQDLADCLDGLQREVSTKTHDLQNKTAALEEVNIALKVLLKNQEGERHELEDRFLLNIRELVLPFAEKIKRSRLDEQQRAWVDTIEKRLRELASPLVKKMHQFHFTATEREVASLICDGKNTKEIADILGISTSSIDTHRNHIRIKLGIRNRNVNLRSCLQTLL